MDISLLLVDYSEAPPEGLGDNGESIQWDRNLFVFLKKNRFPKNTDILS